MNNWKKLSSGVLGVFVVIGLLCAITGCGGGGVDTPPPLSSPPPVDSGLPPDPGEAGLVGLLGVDSDNDGVRDDIQRYIALTYPDSEKTQAALTEFTKGMQEELVNAEDKELSIEIAIKGNMMISCIKYINPENGSRIWRELRAEILNTEERSRAYIQYNDQLGGEVFSLFPRAASSCGFDVDSLPN